MPVTLKGPVKRYIANSLTVANYSSRWTPMIKGIKTLTITIMVNGTIISLTTTNKEVVVKAKGTTI